MQVVGQKTIMSIIDRWEDIPNFIIIQGDSNTGKTYLAQYISQKFNMTYMQLDNGIKTIRDLLSIMTKGANMVYHFKNFDKASIQAKNALLKVTEETPEGNTIIITGKKQISTLESRARKLVLESYSEYDIVEFAKPYFTEKLLKDYYMVGIDTPSKVLMYKDYKNIDDLLKYVLEIYNKLSYMGMDTVIDMISKFSSRYGDGLDVCILFLDMLVNIINAKSKEYSGYKYSYQNVLDYIIDCRETLLRDNTLNRKMLLYKTFYAITLLKGNI